MIYFKDQLELTTTVGQGIFHINFFEPKQHISNILSGESGLVYKGYIKTSVGKDLVAIKTGKGMTRVHAINLKLIFVIQLYFPSWILRDWQKRFLLCLTSIIQILCLSLEFVLIERCPCLLCHSCPRVVYWNISDGTRRS